jgi:hypothetical protein
MKTKTKTIKNRDIGPRWKIKVIRGGKQQKGQALKEAILDGIAFGLSLEEAVDAALHRLSL